MGSRVTVVISAGGTGGHIFPAQALAEELQKKCRVHFVASGLRFFENQNYPLHPVSSGTLSLRGVFKIVKGFIQSLFLLRKLRPNCVVSFGSFHTFPTVVAAKVLRIPVILHEANAIPGKVNKWVSPYAAFTGIHFPQTASLLKGKIIKVGMPVRRALTNDDPCKYFQLKADKKTLLIFGGSQGAAAINEWVLQGVPNGWQIIHCTGSEESARKARALYDSQKIPAYVTPFEQRMDLARKVATCVVGRSGAATITELVNDAIPAILVPYPFATDNHQEYNARYFTDTVKGGVMIKQSALEKRSLKDVLDQFDFVGYKQNIQHHKNSENHPSFSELLQTEGYLS